MYSPIAHGSSSSSTSPTASPTSTVRRARRSDLPAIIQLHLISLPHFFLSAPGPAFLRCFYSFVLRDHWGLLFVSERDGGVAGFLAGFADPNSFYTRFPVGKFRFLVAVAACLLGHPAQLPGLLRDIYRIRRLRDLPDVDRGSVYELITLAVQPQFRRQGHGKALVLAFIDAAQSNPGSQVRVRMDSNDTGMSYFYRRLGFEPFRTFRAFDMRCVDEYVLANRRQ